MDFSFWQRIRCEKLPKNEGRSSRTNQIEGISNNSWRLSKSIFLNFLHCTRTMLCVYLLMRILLRVPFYPFLFLPRLRASRKESPVNIINFRNKRCFKVITFCFFVHAAWTILKCLTNSSGFSHCWFSFAMSHTPGNFSSKVSLAVLTYPFM